MSSTNAFCFASVKTEYEDHSFPSSSTTTAATSATVVREGGRRLRRLRRRQRRREQQRRQSMELCQMKERLSTILQHQANNDIAVNHHIDDLWDQCIQQHQLLVSFRQESEALSEAIPEIIDSLRETERHMAKAYRWLQSLSQQQDRLRTATEIKFEQ